MAVQIFSARRLAVVDASFFAIGLWLAGPLSIGKIGGLFDDYLFVRLANYLLQGQWLGPFDQLTLAKGPFYPMFLAGAVWLGVPVQVATETIYLLGGLLLSRVAGRLAGRPAVGTICFALLVLNPACFDWSTTILMREPLYCGLTLLVLGLSANMLLCGAGAGWPLCLGAALAGYWLTREEGVTLAPPLLLMLGWYFRGTLAVAWQIVRRRPVAGAMRTNAPLWPPLTAALTALCLVLAVCAINRHVYGVFRTNDFQTGPFPRAYGALTRIVPTTWQRLTPIPREARLKAYAVSPAFAELQPFIEGNVTNLATDVECDVTPRPACHDVPGWSFMWVLRDAVKRAGHYTSARQADRFYRRLTREIDSACDRGALTCLGPRRGFMPPLRLGYALPFLRSLAHAGRDTLWLSDAHEGMIMSTLQGPLTPAYDRLAFGTPVSPPQIFLDSPGWQITGAIASTDPAARLRVTAPPGVSMQTDLRITPDPFVNTILHRTGPVAENFSLDLRCQIPQCSLNLVLAGGDVAGSWNPVSMGAGKLLDTPEALLNIESITSLPPYAQAVNAPSVRRSVMHLAARVLPVVTSLAAVPILVWLGWRLMRRPSDGMTILASALFVTVAARIGALALLEATTIPLKLRYEAPAMGPLLCLAGLLLGDFAFPGKVRGAVPAP